jgi:hypothetical protein
MKEWPYLLLCRSLRHFPVENLNTVYNGQKLTKLVTRKITAKIPSKTESVPESIPAKYKTAIMPANRIRAILSIIPMFFCIIQYLSQVDNKNSSSYRMRCKNP